MKRSTLFSRSAALGLALAMILTLTTLPAAASDALGTELLSGSFKLADGVTMTGGSLWSATYSDLRTERYITYTPNAQVSPMLYYGARMDSKAKLSAAAQSLAGQGYRVVAGINGGYFNPDGTQVGLVLTDGIIRGMDKFNYCMVGFLPDGSAFLDNSQIAKRVRWVSWEGLPVDLELTAINASRANGGLYLYDDDFGPSTQNTYAGVDVVLEPVQYGAKPVMNAELPLRVVRVTDSTQEGVTADNAIPAGGFVLSANKNCDEGMLSALRSLLPGTEVTVSVTGGDPRWAGAVCGVSGLYALVRDGQIAPDLPTTAGPCTSIGIKADGSVIFYTIDGRQKGYSVGATHSQVAQRLLELGCVEAAGLDGGGSTTLGASLPGSSGFTVLSRPSGGAERAVNNALFLVTTASSGWADRLYVSTGSSVVLSGCRTTVTAAAADRNGYPASTGGWVNWTSDGGEIVPDGQGGAVFTAGDRAGVFTIDAYSGVSGSAPVRVVDTLSKLIVTRRDMDMAVSSMDLTPGDEVELDAQGLWYNLDAALTDEDVTWSVSGDVGTVDASGHFIAGRDNGTGAVIAQAGGKTVTIEVSVTREEPFTDIADHWSRPYVLQLYDMGIVNGIPQEDGTHIYDPNGILTRGEVVTYLSRLIGADPESYAGVELPFDDAEEIADWQLPNVKAMYAAGVFLGNRDGEKLTADMGDTLNREMILTMLGRVVSEQMEYSLDGMPDRAEISDWAAPYIQTLAAGGVINPNARLSPKDGVTRGEMAMLVAQVSQLTLIQPG